MFGASKTYRNIIIICEKSGGRKFLKHALLMLGAKEDFFYV